MPISWLTADALPPATTPIPSLLSLDPSIIVAGDWSLVSDTAGITCLTTTSIGLGNTILRPATEARLNSRTRFVVHALGSWPGAYHFAVHRFNGTAACLPGVYGGGSFLAYTVDGVNVVALDVLPWSVAPDYSHPIEFILDTYQSGADTILSSTFLDLITGATDTKSHTDTTHVVPQMSGQFGLVALGSGTFRVRRWANYDLDAPAEAPTSFSVSPTTFTATSSGVRGLTLTGIKTFWQPTSNFNISGGNARLIATGFGDQNSFALTFIPGTIPGPITVSDLYGHTVTVTVTGSATGLIPGILSLVLATTTTVQWSCTAVGNATSPVYEVQRSQDPTFALGVTVVGTTLTGTDTGPFTPGGIYYYRVKATEGASVVYSFGRLITGFGLFANPMLPVAILYEKVVMVCTGTSITYGSVSGESPAVRASFHLNRGARQFVVLNRGVPGSQTSDWQTGGTNLPAAIAAGDAVGAVEKWALIEQGVNDFTFSNRSKADYKTNQAATASAWIAAGYRVVFLRPTFAMDSTVGATLAQRLQQYGDAVAELADNTNIFAAGPESFEEGIVHPSGYADGVHQGLEGSRALGEIDGRVLDTVYYAVNAVAPPTPPAVPHRQIATLRRGRG